MYSTLNKCHVTVRDCSGELLYAAVWKSTIKKKSLCSSVFVKRNVHCKRNAKGSFEERIDIVEFY